MRRLIGLLALSVFLVATALVGPVANAAAPIWTLQDAAVARQLAVPPAAMANPSSPTGQPEWLAQDEAYRGYLDSKLALANNKAKVSAKLTKIVRAGKLGAASSIRVIDVATGQVVYDRKPGKARTVASNTKILTAITALERLGTQRTFQTTIRRSGKSATVYFVSGGDPRMTNTKLKSLARQTATAMKQKTGGAPKKVTVRLDDTIFSGPAKHKTWRKGGYNLATIQPIRGTARVEVRSADSAKSAATVFTKYLGKALGKATKAEYKGKRKAPKSASVTGSVQSETTEALVRRMLTNSDNQVAEVLHRHVALAAGYKGTFAGGVKATAKTLRKLGVSLAGLSQVDGSGLSPRNRMTTAFLTRTLRAAANPDELPLRTILYTANSLPLAGRTGTLWSGYGRFSSSESKCAAGLIVAKTGTLDYEIALSGYTVGGDGRLKAFSILVNGVKGAKRTAARKAMDAAAAAVSGGCTR
ncbi:hypothetical protein GCM10010401_16380 [Rarobacter faecitabidus]|uniref:D-alanyl-D-alanine carboxypeptidase/D-alanyl-D-alanine-endopeptidase n=1 Tax=Rarobacter faecitabidus TaxID=13243 RepID=UPI00115142B8|nr:D-alanyl-D-alanine carboxypeptidase [Rarobacter faecitabidus]